jgi:hypothetical protein
MGNEYFIMENGINFFRQITEKEGASATISSVMAGHGLDILWYWLTGIDQCFKYFPHTTEPSNT